MAVTTDDTKVDDKSLPVVDETVVKDDKKVDDTTIVEDEDDSAGEEEETAEALRLYKALQGPGAEKVIRILAQDVGLLETQKDKREARDTILEALEENLGAEYKFLAPKLKGALDKILDAQMRKVDERFSQLSQKELVRESDSAVTELMKEPDFEKYYPRIVQLTKEIHPAENTPPKIFLKRLFSIAKAEASEKGSSENKSNKLKKANDDVPNRLRDSSIGGDDKNLKSDRPLTRKEAIRESLQELSEGDKK